MIAMKRLVIGACSLGALRVMLSGRSQLLGPFPFQGDGDRPLVALTFDDGPNEPYTSQIAQFLHDEGIAATFFQVGRCVERFPATTARIVAQGHVIGNHSYSHHLLRCLAPGKQRRETARTQQLLTASIGRVPALYRPPWLLRTPWLFRTLASPRLQAISGVFCHPWEIFQPDAAKIARHAMAVTGPGTILIFHDGFDSRGGDRSQTVAAVKLVVAGLRTRGYRFTTVDHLLDIPAYQR